MSRMAATERKVRHLPLAKARLNLGAVIRQVRSNKAYVILEQDGLPVAGVMDIEEFEDYLDLRDPVIKRQIAPAGGTTRPGRAVLWTIC